MKTMKTAITVAALFTSACASATPAVQYRWMRSGEVEPAPAELMQCQTFAAQVAPIRAKGYYRNAYWSYGNAIVYGEVVAHTLVAIP
jgi:hypothetical protein